MKVKMESMDKFIEAALKDKEAMSFKIQGGFYNSGECGSTTDSSSGGHSSTCCSGLDNYPDLDTWDPETTGDHYPDC